MFAAFAIREPKRGYYLSSIFIASAFFIAVSADDLLSRSSRALKAVFISLALLAAVYNVYNDLSFRGRQYGYEVAAFLEREGLRFGYSSKLHSHIYTLLSRHRIQVLPVHFMRDRIEPWLWETNLFYYTPEYWRGESFLMVPLNETRENFAMDTSWANTRNKAWGPEADRYFSDTRIAGMFGPPTRMLRFDDMKIYVWDYNIMIHYWRKVLEGRGQ